MAKLDAALLDDLQEVQEVDWRSKFLRLATLGSEIFNEI